jgi:hypothetical protein
MRALCSLILIGSAFVGGYYLGRQPGSPDIIAWGRQTCRQAVSISRKMAVLVKADTKAPQAEQQDAAQAQEP